VCSARAGPATTCWPGEDGLVPRECRHAGQPSVGLHEVHRQALQARVKAQLEGLNVPARLEKIAPPCGRQAGTQAAGRAGGWAGWEGGPAG
jgi:hypothetical protein